MKTTFDLPPDLVRALKLRAVHEGRKLKDLAADLLKRGLAGPETEAQPKPAKPKIEIQSNGLPVVRCAANAPAKRMTADERLALERETLAGEDLQRLGHAL
jgi:plasmid stability protein